MPGDGGYNSVFILQGIDVCFEDADHVPILNNFAVKFASIHFSDLYETDYYLHKTDYYAADHQE